jgi:predicted NBD/HSP70 family sugar kinase/biotin operon repressor
MSIESEAARPKKLLTATTGSVRDINRSILLNLVRSEQPISRADLSRRTGMFRSNVSAIIDELVDEGMLTEERPMSAGRGRVPTHLRLNDSAYPVVGVYVQPATTLVAFAGLNGALNLNNSLNKIWSFPTIQEPVPFVQELRRTITKIQREMRVDRLRRIGIAFPGFVNAKTGRVKFSPGLPEFSGYSLRDEMQRKIGVPVCADNDSNLGALSELWLRKTGEQERPPDFVFISIGESGVGSGAVLNGKLYHGHDSEFAVEFGHMIIDPNGDKCSCGRSGCWERYIRNKATWKRYKPKAAFHKERFIEFVQGARSGDDAAVAALRETASYIALGVSNIAFALNPGELILAGEITGAWDVIREPVEAVFKSLRSGTVLRRARLERELPHLHGAICLALSDVFAKPVLGQ